MASDDLDEDVKPTTNNMPLVAVGLLLLAGIGTMVLFMAVTGRFPKSWILAVSLVEVGSAALLIAVRSSFAGWLVIVVALALAGYHGYEAWKVWQIIERLLPTFGRVHAVDPDVQTQGALARMSRAERYEFGTEAATGMLDLTVFVLLVGTRKGRALLTEG